VSAGKLTKAEIIENIYANVPVSKKNIHSILDLFFEEVKTGVTFELKPRKGRVARNPRTGERVQVENHGVASFRPGRELKERAWSSR
jgi:integration host factor subunit beta